MESALYGGGVPRAVWGRAVDALARFKAAGRAWVDDDRRRGTELYAEFCAAERDYAACRDEADRWAWSEAQASEWERVNRAFDPA